MLEYLLLRNNDIARTWRPCLEIRYHSALIFSLEGRQLRQRLSGGTIVYRLPVCCLALYSRLFNNGMIYFLGSDGLEYQLHTNNRVTPKGLWPADLTHYEAT